MSTPILTELERQIQIRAHKDAIKELSESKSPEIMKKSFNASLDAKRERWAKRHQEEVEKAAGELLKSQAAKHTTTPPAPAPAPPTAAKVNPAPAAPKADPAPVATTITAAQFIAQASHNGPRMARSEFNKLTESQKKRLADANGRIVPDSKAAKPAKPSFSHLTGLARAQAVAKWEAAEKAKNASR